MKRTHTCGELGIKSKNVYFHLEKLERDEIVGVSGTTAYGAKVWKLLK